MKPNVKITHIDQAEEVWVMSDRVRFMGELDGTDLCIVQIDVPPGSGTPPHFHQSIEIFRVLSGVVTFGKFENGEAEFVVGNPGDVVTVPSNAGHNYENRSDQGASMLVVLERSMIDFFREVGRPESPPAGPPPAEVISQLMKVCSDHGVVML